jgi:hypothetical protein
VDNPIDALLRFSPLWIRMLFQVAFICGIIHAVFCFVMGALSTGDSKLWDLWRLRGSLGNSIALYIWAGVLFYSISRSRKATF